MIRFRQVLVERLDSMNAQALKKLQELAIDIDAVAGLIADTQQNNGEIPWSPGDKTDPWDHVEAAMGLCIGGHLGRGVVVRLGEVEDLLALAGDGHGAHAEVPAIPP